MDTNLGDIRPSLAQIKNIPFLSLPDPFKGFSFWADKVVGVSDVAPTDQQKMDAITWIQTLPTEPTQGLLINNFNFKQLWGTVFAALPFTSMMSLGGYQKNVEDMWSWPNRSAIYPFFQALRQAGKATDDDIIALVAAFRDQGIDITTIT